MNDESVSAWLDQLKAGHDDAARQLWDRYVSPLVNLAADRLRNSPNRLADRDDLALQTFEEFCFGVRQKKFPKLNDREDLWQVLVLIAQRRAIDLTRKELAYRKHVLGESVLDVGDPSMAGAPPMQRVPDVVPTADEIFAITEQFTDLLDRLENDVLRAVARCRLAGLTNNEIAEKFQSSLRSVERMVQQIRQCWGITLETS